MLAHNFEESIVSTFCYEKQHSVIIPHHHRHFTVPQSQYDQLFHLILLMFTSVAVSYVLVLLPLDFFSFRIFYSLLTIEVKIFLSLPPSALSALQALFPSSVYNCLLG